MRQPFTYSREAYEQVYHTAEMQLPNKVPEDALADPAIQHYRLREEAVWADLPTPVAGIVLEVACSAGRSAFWLLDHFPGITSMQMFDLSQVAVDYCKRYKAHRDKTLIWQGGIEWINKPTGRYDWVNCVDVTEHLPPDVYQKGIREMLRVCKPGGHLILMAGCDKGCTEHIHLIRDSDLVKDFEAAGWRKVMDLPNRHFLFQKSERKGQ